MNALLRYGIVFFICSVPAVAGNNAAGQDGARLSRVSDTPVVLAQAQIDLTSFSVGNVSVKPGNAAAVPIRLPGQLLESAAAESSYTFVMFKGLPDNITLSSGFRTQNAWMVSIKETRDLKMNVPVGLEGDFNVNVYLYNGEASAPEKRNIKVHISTSSTVDTAASANAGALPVPPQPPRPTVSLEEEKALLTKGEAQLRTGNIVFARLLFEELASRGSAKGAYAVAQTYDPAMLQQLGAVGIQPDVEKAKYWYGKAAVLGDANAAAKLSSFNTGRQ